MRILEERPVAGGERFFAVIGPDPRFRRLTRMALLGALLAVALEVLRAPGNLPPAGRLALALVLFGVSLASAWLSGGAERLVVEGGVVGLQRAGVLDDRGRALALRDLRDVVDPEVRLGTAWGGFALRTGRETLRVGTRLSAADARWLADALRRHVGADPLPATAAGFAPERARAPQILARLQVRR